MPPTFRNCVKQLIRAMMSASVIQTARRHRQTFPQTREDAGVRLNGFMVRGTQPSPNENNEAFLTQMRTEGQVIDLDSLNGHEVTVGGVVATLNNVKAYDTSNFEVRYGLELRDTQNAMNFTIKLPNIRVTSDINARGTYEGNTITYNGSIEVSFTSLVFDGHVNFAMEATSAEPTITSAQVDYNYEGIRVAGVPEEQNATFTRIVVEYLRNKRAEFSQTFNDIANAANDEERGAE